MKCAARYGTKRVALLTIDLASTVVFIAAMRTEPNRK